MLLMGKKLHVEGKKKTGKLQNHHLKGNHFSR